MSLSRRHRKGKVDGQPPHRRRPSGWAQRLTMRWAQAVSPSARRALPARRRLGSFPSAAEPTERLTDLRSSLPPRSTPDAQPRPPCLTNTPAPFGLASGADTAAPRASSPSARRALPARRRLGSSPSPPEPTESSSSSAHPSRSIDASALRFHARPALTPSPSTPSGWPQRLTERQFQAASSSARRALRHAVASTPRRSASTPPAGAAPRAQGTLTARTCSSPSHTSTVSWGPSST